MGRSVKSLRVLCGLCALLCGGLSVWQYQRSLWKTQLLQQIQERGRHTLSLPQLQDDPSQAFYRFRLRGTYDHSHEAVLQGRTWRGRLGVHILTPLQLEDGRTILIDRGWTSRDTLHTCPRPDGRVTVEGLFYPSAKPNFWTPENTPSQGLWYWVELPALLKSSGAFHHLYGLARLENTQAAAPHSNASPSLPNNHFSYMLTWGALGIALLVIFCLI